MKKSELIKEIAKRKGIPKNKAKIIVEGIFDEIAKALASGERVEIRGLGTFKTKKRPQRVAKDPRTGAEIVVREKTVPVFKMSKSLKQSLNGSK